MPFPTPICRSDQIPEQGRLVLTIAQQTIGIFRINGRLHAYDNTCPHQGGPVCQGTVIPRVVEKLSESKASAGFEFDPTDLHIVCPWHGFEFSIVTGCHAATGAIRLKSVSLEEIDGNVYLMSHG